MPAAISVIGRMVAARAISMSLIMLFSRLLRLSLSHRSVKSSDARLS
jgi:hypothetical protein